MFSSLWKKVRGYRPNNKSIVGGFAVALFLVIFAPSLVAGIGGLADFSANINNENYHFYGNTDPPGNCPQSGPATAVWQFFRRISGATDTTACGWGWGFGLLTPSGCGEPCTPQWGYGYGYGYGYLTETPEQDGTYPVDPEDLPNLASTGLLKALGNNPLNTTQITWQVPVRLRIQTPQGVITVSIAKGTTFTSAVPTNFTQLRALLEQPSINGSTEVLNAFEFGFLNLGLTINPGMVVRVPVNPAMNGQLVTIMRRAAGGASFGSWGTCRVTSGICEFTITQLSSYAVTQTTVSGGGGGGISSIPSGSAAQGIGFDKAAATAAATSISADKGLAAASGATACTPDSLIRGMSHPAVYYCGIDGKRYVFPNEKTYKTWYPDFSGVQFIDDASLASASLGGNVTYKPGVMMIKIQTDPKVYAVGSGGTLHWVTTESIAASLYGANWNTMIHDVSDAFFVNYKTGANITQ